MYLCLGLHCFNLPCGQFKAGSSAGQLTLTRGRLNKVIFLKRVDSKLEYLHFRHTSIYNTLH